MFNIHCRFKKYLSNGSFQVFKPPNPWTMGIMNVLAELHMEPDLKLNLKFEIEVLCKTLSIDLNVSYLFVCISSLGVKFSISFFLP